MSKNLKTTINMFQNLGSAPTKVKSAGSNVALILVLVILAVVVFGGYFLVSTQNRALDAKIAEAENYVYDASNIAGLQEIQSLQSQIDQYGGYDGSIDLAQAAVTSITQFNSGVYQKIMSVKPDRVTLTGLSFADGTLTIECTTADNLPPADFVQALDRMDYFLAVGYQGFSESPEAGYVFPVTCVLPGGGLAE